MLRLLRGEDLDLVSRALGMTAATLSGWRDAFTAGDKATLATRPTDGEAFESERLKARLGEIRSHRTCAMGARLLERELLEPRSRPWRCVVPALLSAAVAATIGSHRACAMGPVCG